MPEFEWDDQKAERNFVKHGVRFDIAAQIFGGLRLTVEDDRRDFGEARKISVGEILADVALVVIYTERNGVIRIISARRASRREREQYREHCAQAEHREDWTGGIRRT